MHINIKIQEFNWKSSSRSPSLRCAPSLISWGPIFLLFRPLIRSSVLLLWLFSTQAGLPQPLLLLIICSNINSLFIVLLIVIVLLILFLLLIFLKVVHDLHRLILHFALRLVLLRAHLRLWNPRITHHLLLPLLLYFSLGYILWHFFHHLFLHLLRFHHLLLLGRLLFPWVVFLFRTCRTLALQLFFYYVVLLNFGWWVILGEGLVFLRAVFRPLWLLTMVSFNRGFAVVCI